MRTPAVSTVGFARWPLEFRSLWDEATANAETAARVLRELMRHPRRASQLVDEIAALEREGDRVTRDLRRELGERFALRLQPSHLVPLVEALDEVVDAIDDAAFGVSLGVDALPDERRQVLGAVVCDLVRDTVSLTRRMHQPVDARAPVHERVHRLRDDWHRELRAAHATAVLDRSDTMRALRAAMLLRRLRKLSDANQRLERLVEIVAAELD